MIANILLVDSVCSFREEVALQLERLGYRAIETECGEDALVATTGVEIDVVVMDNDLPDKTGLELIPEIRAKIPHVQILLVVDSSDMSPSEKRTAEKNGVSQIIPGPISPHELVQRVARALADNTSSISEMPTIPPRPKKGSPKNRPETASSNGNASVDEKVKEMRRAYQERLPQELEKLRAALTAARDRGGDVNALEEAHRLAHTLCGTSGTLGFDEVSELAGRMDAALKRMIRGSARSTEEWDEIFRILRRAETVPERLSLVISVEPHTNNIATVLIADPHPERLLAISHIAHKRAIDVKGATTFEELLKLAAMGRVDGAIIDIGLDPRVPLVQIVEALHHIDGMKDLPIAMMSEDCSVEHRVATTHAGASHFLSKPIHADELASTIQHFMATHAKVVHRVLILDDDEPFRERVSLLLTEEGFRVSSVGDPKEIMDAVETVKPDLILLDVIMPHISGFDVCRMLRSSSRWKEVPILFLTAETDPKDRLECFRSGGDDYITKPVIKEELLARIGVRLERIRLYKEKADRDPLTTLPTRRAFIEAFKVRIAEGLRYNRPASLCLMDIDRFKHVNDHYGHLTGDQVLANLGRLLGSRFRAVDIRGRWGGEEFTLVFYGEDRATSMMILSRVLEEFRMTQFEGEHGEAFHCTFSCGIAELPSDGTSTDELFRVADERLYKAKEGGRNQIVIE